MTPQPLAHRVAVVAGATRGAGRGIARMLGEAGATVYCTGRSSRAQPNTSSHIHAGRPETIEETAELVDAAGGTGIPVRVDHTAPREVAALFARIEREQKRLDVLVNILTGEPVKKWSSFWKLPAEDGRIFFDSWLWPHVVTSRHAAPLMVKGKAGLIVEIIEQHGIGYHGQFYFDLMEISLKRLAYALAFELAPKGVAAIAITPGFMRTEAILEKFGVTEANWQDAAEHNREASQWGFSHSETPCFVGRGVAALATDPHVMRKSGGIFTSWSLAEEYGHDDVDGRRPNMWAYLQAHVPHAAAQPPLEFDWTLSHRHHGVNREHGGRDQDGDCRG
jgi:NAD(P)-dependent dehydrogenase (short-subunit alcohol dehydrogenase family)